MAETSKPKDDKSKFSLPQATTFDGVNQNFETLTDLFTGVIGELKVHSENTNQNLAKLAEETSENLNKLADDMKSILSSQTMMLSIIVIFVCFIIIVGKGLFDVVSHFLI